MLENEINKEYLNLNDEKLIELSLNKEQLAEIRKENIDAVMFRSKCRYQDLGVKASRYFFNLENRNYTNKVMTKLVDGDGAEYTETKDILNYQHNFYEQLYDNVNIIEDNPIESLIGENLTKLSSSESDSLEGKISLHELSEALKNMKNEKSPGMDGFTVEFFLFFWIDLGFFVLRSINYGYQSGFLSITQKQGIITCLPKPNKSRHLLKNWRPISLLNVVYKMASAVIANRLKTVLDKRISEGKKVLLQGDLLQKM